ncbi:hypothetical protein C7212DRAFT_337511 [Tuber magnatum]|uniref:Uncharacterized protein n=1 Tax=Tuber magnatum TaxID=42249 RepID=A0A317SER8_9PEZI|nr:hypothetical protein C7212DRAFT_337511 [Tuber magnatum]
MEEVRKEEVEGMKMVALVDDSEERIRKMERGLRKELAKWEVDVQTMKLEAMWMGKDRNEWEGGIECSESIGSVVSE